MKMHNWMVAAWHVVIAGLVATVVACVSYAVMDSALRTARAETLQSYIRVRADREQNLFDEARTYIEAAEQSFLRRLEQISPEQAEAEFNRFFPEFGDGTRRSVDALFDGTLLASGDYVFGVGAFLADSETMTVEDQRRYLAAFHTVRAVGEAHLGTFSSLYYFTPDRRVLMFAPQREDRLMFYRREAPADFQLQADEDPRLFSLVTNPNSDMQCTRLSRFVYNDSGERSATACRMPMREGETLLGAFGTSIMMTDYLSGTLENPPNGGLNMMFDRDGAVIARGTTTIPNDHSHVSPDEIMGLLQDDPRPRGIVEAADRMHLIAFNRIAGPDWYFVSVVPLEDLEMKAQHQAFKLFIIAFIVSLIGASVRGAVRRWTPLSRFLEARRKAGTE
ncbi:cache domain-containing protein [Maricaulis parjimensis]|uniref:cache domain-containing protein n=1 Tax=Maricaulis parjimensis TaxID=144023 RepID=UPI00193AA9D8|nr:cache domain-containing protein [Maricaulis parjimensis]